MALTHQHTTDEVRSIAIVAVDPEQAQRASEAHAAINLMACQFGLVGSTQLLVTVLGHLS